MAGRSVTGCVLLIVLTIQCGVAFHFPDVAQLKLSDVLNKNCGSTEYDNRDRPPEGRIQESPWLVLFFFPDEPGHFCHGTLITTKHILTTAVCASNIAENETTVALGEYDLHADRDCEGTKCSDPVQWRLAQKVIVHEHYDEVSFVNDLAVVVMDHEVTLSDSVKPICLPLIPIGIGTVNQPNVYNALWTTNPRPQQHWMRYVELNSCRKLIENQIMLKEGQICARSFQNRTIEMIGGAGSALEVEHHDRIYQVGMLSIGILDADAGTPFVYVDIPKYVKWIHDSVKKNQ